MVLVETAVGDQHRAGAMQFAAEQRKSRELNRKRKVGVAAAPSDRFLSM
jgi:hypothetical protein